MRRNCRYHGEVICIKNGKYGSMYVPEEKAAPKEGKKPSGENALDEIRKEIERIKDETIKKNRDNLDAVYNIDMRNMSESMKRLFASWTDGINKANASVETIANSQEAVVKLVAQYDENIAAIQAKADANSTSITSITQWQRETEKSIASISQTASSNETSITQLVKVIGKDGETITASIKAAVIDDESFIELIADRVTVEGTAEFVTRRELEDDSGSTEISGNLIVLNMDGTKDDGETNLTSSSKLGFRYTDGNMRRSFGNIYTYIDGESTDETSRYVLWIQTDPFPAATGETARPAIKINPYGSLSLESDNGAIFAEARYGYCLLSAGKGTRIRAESEYSDILTGAYPSMNDYVFASDGIYYAGVKIVPT